MPLEQMIEGYHRDEMLLLYFSPIMEFKYLWELAEMFMAAHTPASWASTTQGRARAAPHMLQVPGVCHSTQGGAQQQSRQGDNPGSTPQSWHCHCGGDSTDSCAAPPKVTIFQRVL